MMKIYILMLTLFVPIGMIAQSDRHFIRSGNRSFRVGNYSKAETEYRKAIEQNDGNAVAHYNLGCALLMQQKDSDAVVQFEHAGKMENAKARKAKAYHNIGTILQGRRIYDKAIIAYEESLRNNPSDDQTRYNLALCKRLLRQQKKNESQQKNKSKQDSRSQKKERQQSQSRKQEQDSQPNAQPQEKMSKENAEQFLNAVIQKEQQTRNKLDKAAQRSRSRKLEKNW